MKIGNRDWGIFYALTEEIAIFTNHLEGIKSTIDLLEEESLSLRNSTLYNDQIAPLLSSSDEISYFNIKKIAPLFFKNDMPEFIKIIKSVSSGRNYFNDGIVTINYLNIE